MGEKILYDAPYEDIGNIVVSDTRLVIGNTTYSMSNITSVSIIRIPPNRGFGILLAVLGVFAAGFSTIADYADATWGIGLFILGLIIAAKAKGRYSMRMGSAGGERNALWSSRRKDIEPVVKAIEKAMVMRG